MGKKIFGILATAAVAGAVTEYGIARYFFRRTMLRTNAKQDRTRKMSGTDWDVYILQIHKDREWIEAKNPQEVYITSGDGLRLHGNFISCGDSKKVVICFHGYTSEGMNDYTSLARFYYEQGFNLLIIDARAHGKSEGTYIGFGCLDRYDALLWIDYVINRIGQDCSILLHGDSMGAATVLMTTGLELPPQVKAAVSDCAFTSPWEVFASVLKNMYHIPPLPILTIADRMVKKEAGYGLDECNARREVAKTKIPVLFVHGEKDTFVPCSMGHELYEACAAPKRLLIVEGASHVESYYKNPAEFEQAIREFILPYMKEGQEV